MSSPLWLCLHLPDLALDALGPWPPGVPLPVIVWHGEQGGQRVWQANAAARALGVHAGQRLPSAQALVPQALVRARDPVREHGHLQRLALALAAFTPNVRIEQDDVLLELHASLRLFGGVRTLLRRARQAVAGAGGAARWGMAPTALAARLFARRPRRVLQSRSLQRHVQRLPLELLAQVAALPAAPLQMLQALGARRIGDLQALPRSGLARRGALAWLAALDRATGQRPEPGTWLVIPERFEATLELAWRADQAPMLETALVPLLQALAGWLRLRWQAATRLSLHLKPEHGARRQLAEQVLTLQLALPSRDADHLQTLLRERLLLTPLDAPVDALRLCLDETVADAGRPTALLPDAPAEQASTEAELIDRLRARLGHDCVQRIALQPDPRPEKADLAQPPDRRITAPAIDPLLALRPRPAWLLPEPVVLDAQDDRPWLQGQPLQLLPGTERIEFGWHDGWLVRRDYHVARAADGTLHWLFREFGSGPGALDDPIRWHLHGLFA